MRFRITAAAVLAGALAASSAHAQTTPLHAGQRVRIALPDTAFIGTVAGEVFEATADSFTIQIHKWQRTLAYRDVKEVEVSEGRGPRPRSMAIGAALGFLAGEGASLIDKAVQPKDPVYVTDCDDPTKCPPYLHGEKSRPYPARYGGNGGPEARRWAWSSRSFGRATAGSTSRWSRGRRPRAAPRSG